MAFFKLEKLLLQGPKSFQFDAAVLILVIGGFPPTEAVKAVMAHMHPDTRGIHTLTFTHATFSFPPVNGSASRINGCGNAVHILFGFSLRHNGLQWRSPPFT